MNKMFKFDCKITLKDIFEILKLFIFLFIIIIIYTYVDIKYGNAKFYVFLIGIGIYLFFLYRAYFQNRIKVFLLETLSTVFLIGLLIFIGLNLKFIKENKSVARLIVEKDIKEKYDINFSHKKIIFKTDDERKKYKYADIKEKIIILKNLGLSKEDIYDKLKNNITFRTIIKNGNNKFYEIYKDINDTSQSVSNKKWR